MKRFVLVRYIRPGESANCGSLAETIYGEEELRSLLERRQTLLDFMSTASPGEFKSDNGIFIFRTIDAA